MNVYSDRLDRADLYDAQGAAGLDDIWLETMELQRPRKRKRGWKVRLEAMREHGRRRNSGTYGAEEARAATYQEHGWWMVELFKRDPEAVVGPYDGVDDFRRQTARAAEWGPKWAAPWLEELEAVGNRG